MASTSKYDRLKTLLQELFQLDQPDLDFGLYRIMHAKAGEIIQFLDRDLLPQVRHAFEKYQPADKAAIRQRLNEAIAAAESLGVDPETNQKVQGLKAELEAGVDIAALEDEVYDHLFSFFRRYYSDGDFLAKRVYKPGVYAVPYEGEEVVLHWANKDQYYIKTSEYLRDYAFRLKPESETNPMRVHFRLVAAAEGEHGNNKAAEGRDRVFILAPAGETGRDFLTLETVGEQPELVIAFEYRPATMEDWSQEALASATAAASQKPPKQKDLTDIAVKAILAVADESLTTWITELAKPHVRVDGETTDYSRLQGHLNRYTARHSFDYFIHKNLGGFLRRELDFYIKNEVMHLDDIENEDAPKVEQYLSKIKVIRAIAGKVIDFLAQLEDFQKLLWVKKKFVTETFYCIRVGCIPKAFLAEVAANDAQRQEWVNLCRIDEIESARSASRYSEPLTPEFLLSHPTLVLDTRHFNAHFTERLLEALGDLATMTSGIVIHSDNWQALRLLQTRFHACIKSVYIDPPYNTGNDGFVYKDAFKSSTWAAMIRDRLLVASSLLVPDGVHFCSINEIERATLEWQCRDVFGFGNRVEELIWVRDTVSNNAPAYSTNHEYIEAYSRDKRAVEANRKLFRTTRQGFAEVMALLEDANPKCLPPEEVQVLLRELYREHQRDHLVMALAKGESKEDAKKSDPWKGLYPYKWLEYRTPDGRLVEHAEAKRANATLWAFREVEPSMPAGKQAESIKDPNSDNFRFYTPPHPETGMPCKGPKRGWAFPQIAVDRRPSFDGYVSDNRIVFKDSGQIPQLKYFLHEVESVVATSVIRQYADGEPQLEALFGTKGLIDNPKPIGLVRTLVNQTALEGDVVLDYFAGSGTTAHSVIEQNRSDGLCRQFVLVEVAGHFDSVLVPRIKKAIFAPTWKAGHPTELASEADEANSPAIVMGLRLESYEDAVASLRMERTQSQRELLSLPEVSRLREQFVLKYSLESDARGSNCLVNSTRFMLPMEYTLDGHVTGSDEIRLHHADLIETFNWLIGLRVNHFAASRGYSIAMRRGESECFGRDCEQRLQINGRLREDADGPWWFRTVTGTTPDGKRILIIWRKRPGGDTPEGIEQDNLVLDEWFRKQEYSTTDSEFDLVYVNGDNNLANLRQQDASDTGLTETGWKVRIIEEDFHRLMFEGTE